MPIVHLYISEAHNYFGHHGMPAGEAPMLEVDAVECVAGAGIRGDRFFNYKPDYKGQITFFAGEHLQQMWDELQLPAEARDPSATRRNVITEGLNLNALIGQEFELQGVRFLGMEECRPCYWMNGAIHSEAEAWMRGRGGLRAKILTDGTLYAPSRSCIGVLFAGGQSKRMGCDKALLEIEGTPLWRRQWQTLRAVCAKRAVSARQNPSWLPAEAVWIADDTTAQGPLAGLSAALGYARTTGHSHLLALAVDLPSMSAVLLRSLLNVCSPGVGAIKQTHAAFEPLCTVYPVETLEAVQSQIYAGNWKLQALIETLIHKGHLKLQEASTTETHFFTNLNTPEDWEDLQGKNKT